MYSLGLTQNSKRIRQSPRIFANPLQIREDWRGLADKKNSFCVSPILDIYQDDFNESTRPLSHNFNQFLIDNFTVFVYQTKVESLVSPIGASDTELVE